MNTARPQLLRAVAAAPRAVNRHPATTPRTQIPRTHAGNLYAEFSRPPTPVAPAATGAGEPLTRQQPDGGDEFVAALVARPGVIDPAPNVEPGLLGHEQHTAALGTIWPPEAFGHSVACRKRETGGLDSHRRSSSTPSPHPSTILHRVCGATATRA